MDCAKYLENQVWYWGNSSKEEIAEAMAGKPDGTFAVRDAASAGRGFTLTLRIDGNNFLMRIYVSNGKCGFTPENLEFDSVVELIEFYSSNSLKEFNDKLCSNLLHPLHNPKISGKENTDVQNGTLCPSRTNLFMQLHFLEFLYADYERASKRYDQMFLERTNLLEGRQRKNAKITAFSDAFNVFSCANSKLKGILNSEILPSNEREMIRSNIQLQQKKIEEISQTKELLQNSLNEVDGTLQEMDRELDELKPRKRNECIDALLATKAITRTQIEKCCHSVSLALDCESDPIITFMLQIPTIWAIEDWLTEDSSKDSAVQAIMKKQGECGEDKDGIFLIRPSQSRPGFFALELTKNATVHSCLIEKRQTMRNMATTQQSMDYSCSPVFDAENNCTGYAFNNTNVFFCSLADFVKYYSQVPLAEHNHKLDTTLNIPAFQLLSL